MAKANIKHIIKKQGQTKIAALSIIIGRQLTQMLIEWKEQSKLTSNENTVGKRDQKMYTIDCGHRARNITYFMKIICKLFDVIGHVCCMFSVWSIMFTAYPFHI